MARSLLRTKRVALAAVIGLASLAACGGRATGEGGPPEVRDEGDARGHDRGQAEVSPREPPRETRARSEPPPGPPLPAGVTALRKDVVALALSGDGRLLAGGDLAGRALLWDLARGVFVVGSLTPEGNRIRPVVFAAQGTRWLAGAFDRPDRPWRVYDGDGAAEPRLVFGEPAATAVDAALSADGGRVVTASEHPDEIAVRALPDGTVAWREAAHAEVVAIDPSGAAIALADGPRIRVLALPDGAERLAVTEAVDVARLALDGATLAAAEGPRVVTWALDGAARRSVALRDESRPVRELRWLPLGAPLGGTGAAPLLVAVTRPEVDGLVLWRADDGGPLVEVPMGCACETHALSADGCVAACACRAREEIRWSRVNAPACGAAPARAPGP